MQSSQTATGLRMHSDTSQDLTQPPIPGPCRLRRHQCLQYKNKHKVTRGDEEGVVWLGVTTQRSGLVGFWLVLGRSPNCKPLVCWPQNIFRAALCQHLNWNTSRVLNLNDKTTNPLPAHRDCSQPSSPWNWTFAGGHVFSSKFDGFGTLEARPRCQPILKISQSLQSDVFFRVSLWFVFNKNIFLPQSAWIFALISSPVRFRLSATNGHRQTQSGDRPSDSEVSRQLVVRVHEDLRAPESSNGDRFWEKNLQNRLFF